MTLPILYLDDFEKNQEQFLKDLRNVVSTIGFFYLKNHGIDESLSKKLFALSKDFFALSSKQKDEISMIHSPQFRGYSSEGGEYTAGAKDYREQIDIGTEREALKWDLSSPLWQRLEGPNLWPKQVPELKDTFLKWHEQTQNACLKLLRAFAKALNLDDADAFSKLYGRNSYEHCKLLRYPAQSGESNQGVGSHKDGGLITFVLQEEQSGLQALINGKWLDVPPLKGSVVVNIGEFLELATNGYLKATIHRVNLSPKERFSIAYFLGVQLDKDIPIFDIGELAKESSGVDTDPKNPLLRNVAQNYFKRMIRSHPDVAKAHHSDLIEKFSFA